MATLIYLSIQIKNNTTMTRASMRQGRMESGIQLGDAFFNSPYLPAIALKMTRGDDLTEEEALRIGFYNQIWHRTQEISFLQAQEGLLDDTIVEGMKSIILAQADGSLFRDWEWRKRSLDPGYVALVDSILAEKESLPTDRNPPN